MGRWATIASRVLRTERDLVVRYAEAVGQTIDELNRRYGVDELLALAREWAEESGVETPEETTV